MRYVKGLKDQPFYVWLFAAYPVLYLYAYNMVFLNSREMLRVLGIVLLIESVVFAVLVLLFKNKTKAALVTTSLSALFFSYGHVYYLGLEALQKIKPGTVPSHYVCYPLFIDLFVLVLLLSLKYHQAIRKAALYLNVTGLVLMAFVAAQIGAVLRIQHNLRTEIAVEAAPALIDRDELPDIYYIVLDAYGRADLLLEQFGYDNSEFIAALTARGFYVASRSCSNYGVSSLSIPSALNMKYFDREQVSGWGWRLAYNYLALYGQRNSRAGQALKDRGYTYVHFVTGYPSTNRSDVADIMIDFGPDGSFVTRRSSMSQIMNVLLPTTLYLPFFVYQGETDTHSYEFIDPRRILLELEELERIPLRDEPTFTVAHILKPHYPYSFDREGNILPTPPGWNFEDDTLAPDADQRYIDQVVFINKRILDVIDHILTTSDRTPIIILQGDHGWRRHDLRYNEDRQLILNAYLVPDAMREKLYSTITPVNSFRLLLDTIFGTNLGLLPDQSFPSYDKKRLFELNPMDPSYRVRCEDPGSSLP